MQAGEGSGDWPITATALLASISDTKQFANGRQLAVWLGLAPRQHSTGGKSNLLGISKRGDCYLRTLLIHGARAVILTTERKPTTQGWLVRLLERRHKNVAAIVLAPMKRYSNYKGTILGCVVLAGAKQSCTGFRQWLFIPGEVVLQMRKTGGQTTYLRPPA